MPMSFVSYLSLTPLKNHLISLGVSERWTPLVWLIGPLCGIIVQPLVGTCSDRASSQYGRRRPFIACGMVGAVASMLTLAWAEDVAASLFTQPLNHGSATQQLVTKIVAVISILCLNTSVQPIQMGFRALAVDNVRHDQQARVNTWTASLVGLGNIVGHLSGSFAVETRFITRYQTLTLIAVLCLLGLVSLSCWLVEEAPSSARHTNKGAHSGHPLRQLMKTYSQAEPSIKSLYSIQFFSWMAWFPFLFYSSR